MKIAVIPDQHQHTHWKKIIPRIDEFDKIIFLGDYFDDWKNKWPHQMTNFLSIIKFKKENLEKVDLLWGNHETSYYHDEQCSGYQYEHYFEIVEVLRKNKNLLEVVSIYDKWIFCHAGVSEAWMKCAAITDVNSINDLFKERPNYFRWVGPHGAGDNYNEGPLWIRPNALMANAVDNYHQCVGHTELAVGPTSYLRNDCYFVYTDTREHNYVTIIDTETNDIRHEV